ALLVALFELVTRHAHWVTVVLVSALAWVALARPWVPGEGGRPVRAAGGLVAIAGASLLGLYASQRERLMASLKAEQEALSERAAADERAYIATEMHDMVAHKVSLMVLHAGALELNANGSPVVEREAAV